MTDIFKKLFEQSKIGLAVNSLSSGTFIHVNEALANLTGYSLTELNHLSYWDLTPKCYAEQEKVQLDKLQTLGFYGPYEKKYIHASGRKIDVRLNGCVFYDENGEAYILSTVEDISDHNQTHSKLQLASLIIQTSLESILVLNDKLKIIKTNPAFSKLTGYPFDEVQNQYVRMICSNEQQYGLYKEIKATLDDKGYWQGEIWGKTKYNQTFPARVVINITHTNNTNKKQYIVTFSDITEQFNHKKELWKKANIDALTGLANRYYLINLLESLFRKKQPFSLLFLDLDDFKSINDTLGHQYGDRLLAKVSERLITYFGTKAQITRHGGDEFILVLENIVSKEQIKSICKDIIHQVTQPYILENENIYISLSIGIALHPDNACKIDKLFQYADQALMCSKKKGKNRYSFFSIELHNEITETSLIANELRYALQNNQLKLFFQPIVNTTDLSIQKAECLIRWFHLDMGMIPPGKFIAIAENKRMINQLGTWIARRFLEYLIEWNFSEQYQFSINISPWQLDIINKDFWDEFLTTVERHNLSKNIILEITENCLSISTKYTTLLFEKIQQLGIEVAVDDFGTGYSSLSYLKQFHVDYLKIDRAFIMNIDTDNSNQILTSAMTAMAHKLNIKVVAEGVETKEESQFLQQLNCDYQQGYLHYKPMPAEELHTLLCQQDSSNPTKHKT